ncbi:hypothetical protein C8F01DRAFT_29352 [Mycena amicta]|nr:hypothetical protein C8F01DRAFT_29352 [Mycena amicta]
MARDRRSGARPTASPRSTKNKSTANGKKRRSRKVTKPNDDDDTESESGESIGSEFLPSVNGGKAASKRVWIPDILKSNGDTKGESSPRRASSGKNAKRRRIAGITSGEQVQHVKRQEDSDSSVLSDPPESPILAPSEPSATNITGFPSVLVEIPPSSLPVVQISSQPRPRKHRRLGARWRISRQPRRKLADPEPPELNPFDDVSELVSEADILDRVESLNDSLDTRILQIIEKALILNKTDMQALHDLVQFSGSNSQLVSALSKYAEDEGKQGYLFDAIIHDILVSHIHEYILSGDVVSRYMDPQCVVQALFDDLSSHQPWRATQRWRSIAASSADRISASDPRLLTAVGAQTQCQCIVVLFASAFRRPVGIFEFLRTDIESAVMSLYQEARDVATTIRRDVLSVRLSVDCPLKPPSNIEYYDHSRMDVAWSGMGEQDGDEILGRYHFGLRRRVQDEISSYLKKPKVVTTALLRDFGDGGAMSMQGEP